MSTHELIARLDTLFPKNLPEKVHTIALIMDNRGDSNWGSQATTAGLIKKISEQFPNAKIVSIHRHEGKPKIRQLRKLCHQKCWDALRDGNFGPRWLQKVVTGRWLTKALKADLIIVNGEGSFHNTQQSLFWLYNLAYLRSLTKAPLWIVNSSIYAKGSRYEPLYIDFLKHIDYLSIREPNCFRELQELGIPAILSTDCAVLTEPTPPDELLAQKGIQKPYAVFTGSNTVHHWPLDTQRKLIQKTLDAGLEIVYTSSETEDDANYRALGLPLPFVTHEDANPSELMGLQQQAQFVVGGRFHPTLLAGIAGTPFLVVTSNTQKMRGLAEMLGAPESLFEMQDEAGQLAYLDQLLKNAMSKETV